PIKLFINSANKTFCLINTIHQNGKDLDHLPWTMFIFKPANLECVDNMCTIISVHLCIILQSGTNIILLGH
ncbi:hypothetical protein PAXRUDRAFT_155562, partial [Paxillus rubicundulus Ve08.2h10]